MDKLLVKIQIHGILIILGYCNRLQKGNQLAIVAIQPNVKCEMRNPKMY
jgi:hypothetical protein